MASGAASSRRELLELQLVSRPQKKGPTAGALNDPGRRDLAMSALGHNHKRTLRRVQTMSALLPKVDIVQPGRDVRFVPKADIRLPLTI
jgi:hypothetical protein